MRSRQFLLSEQAAEDLTNIYAYIAELDQHAARKVVDGIKFKIRSIASLGLTGSPQDETRDGLRMAVFRHYRIYFSAAPSHLTVLPILHGRQTIGPSTFSESEPS